MRWLAGGEVMVTAACGHKNGVEMLAVILA
jgi:hypothetical protein